MSSQPLRIGILGAARIAPGAIVWPAHQTGARLVAVAARDTGRARSFAAEHGVERVVPSYQDVIDDPEVEVVYNPLPNGLHAPWNLRAIRAGKHVLTEKPSASNATEAAAVRDAVSAAPGQAFVEGFHYRFHPMMARVLDLVRDGAIGEVRHIEASLTMPPPVAGDPRWSLALAGGAMMDLGCYATHVCRSLGPLLGGEPSVVGARGGTVDGAPDAVEAWLDADLVYPAGATASARCGMVGDTYRFRLSVLGTAGKLEAPTLLGPVGDRALEVSTRNRSWAQTFGPKTTYTYQLEAFTAHVREGAGLPIGADDALAQSRLMDECFRAAGLPLRPSTSLAG